MTAIDEPVELQEIAKRFSVVRDLMNSYNAACENLAALRAENERMRDELGEWNNASKFVADGCKDQLHCGCVPILRRELDAANKAVDEARAILSQIDYWADSDWEIMADAWLTAHPAKSAGQDPKEQE